MKRRIITKAVAIISGAVIAATGVFALTPVNAKAHPFKDVTESDWFNGDVERAFRTGLVNGKDGETFDPFGNLSAAETVKLAVAMNQKTLDGAVTVTNGEPWYSTWVAVAKEKGIISRDYDWNKPVTRAQYMAIFAKALPDSYFQAINNVPDGSVPDVSQNLQEAAAIYKLYRAGIVEGNDAVTRACLPNNMITRGEVSAITTRIMDASTRKAFVMSGGSSGGTTTGQPEGPATPETPGAPETPETPSEAAELKFTKDADSDGAEFAILPSETKTLSVKVTGGVEPYAYQWVKDDTKISGADKEEYTPGAGTYGVFRCEVKDSKGTEITSAEVTIRNSQKAKLEFTKQPQPKTQKIKDGKIAVSCEVKNNDGKNVIYKLQKSVIISSKFGFGSLKGRSRSVWMNVSGQSAEGGAKLDQTFAVTSGGTYRIRAELKDDPEVFAVSESFTVEEEEKLSAVLTYKPGKQLPYSLVSEDLSVEVKNGSGNYEYRFEYRNTGTLNAWKGIMISGKYVTNTPNYTLNLVTSGNPYSQDSEYRCVVTDKDTGETAETEPVKIPKANPVTIDIITWQIQKDKYGKTFADGSASAKITGSGFEFVTVEIKAGSNSRKWTNVTSGTTVGPVTASEPTSVTVTVTYNNGRVLEKTGSLTAKTNSF